MCSVKLHIYTILFILVMTHDNVPQNTIIFSLFESLTVWTEQRCSALTELMIKHNKQHGH